MNFLSNDTLLLRFPVDMISVTTQYWISLKRRMKTSKLLVFWWLWKRKKICVCVSERDNKPIFISILEGVWNFFNYIKFFMPSCRRFFLLVKAHHRAICYASSLVKNVYQLTFPHWLSLLLLLFQLPSFSYYFKRHNCSAKKAHESIIAIWCGNNEKIMLLNNKKEIQGENSASPF